MSALENDPEFRSKLDKADEADIRVSERFARGQFFVVDWVDWTL